jgi:hypothetical protein
MSPNSPMRPFALRTGPRSIGVRLFGELHNCAVGFEDPLASGLKVPSGVVDL